LIKLKTDAYLAEFLLAKGYKAHGIKRRASTSELYGKVRETPQTEKTPFYPDFGVRAHLSI